MTAPGLTPHRSDVPADRGATRALPGMRGLPWFVLRVHRTSLWIWTAFVVAASGWLLVLYAVSREKDGPDLGAVSQLGFLATVLAYLPFAVAAYAGGALIGRELEGGTDGLAFTQSVRPLRWLAAQLALPALLITVGSALLNGLFRWVWMSRGDERALGWFESDPFHATGVVGPAYVLLGLAVGALAGMLTRRTLPGMGLALGAVLSVYAAGNTLRFLLWPRTVLTGDQATRVPVDARPFGGFEDISFTPRSERFCDNLEFSPELEKCLDKYGGVVHRSYDIVPASQYWPMQLVEAGIVLALAALATAGVFWLLRRRTP